MKLNEIKKVHEGTINLSEGVIPVHITMTLEQIIAAGKITNNVQNFVLAGLVGMYKNGGPTRWPRDLNAYGDMSTMATSSDLIESVKKLSDKEAVEVATWLYGQLQFTGSFESNPYAGNPQMETVEWVRWVLQKQK